MIQRENPGDQIPDVVTVARMYVLELRAIVRPLVRTGAEVPSERRLAQGYPISLTPDVGVPCLQGKELKKDVLASAKNSDQGHQQRQLC